MYFHISLFISFSYFPLVSPSLPFFCKFLLVNLSKYTLFLHKGVSIFIIARRNIAESYWNCSMLLFIKNVLELLTLFLILICSAPSLFIFLYELLLDEVLNCLLYLIILLICFFRFMCFYIYLLNMPVEIFLCIYL